MALIPAACSSSSSTATTGDAGEVLDGAPPIVDASADSATSTDAANDATPDGAAPPLIPGASCLPGATLTGGTYTIAKSKFAFGNAPKMVSDPDGVRWVGDWGSVLISPSGYANGASNSYSLATGEADWSGDSMMQQLHNEQYLESFDVDPCQVQSVAVYGKVKTVCGAGDGGVSDSGADADDSDGSSNCVLVEQRIIRLARGLDGILVVESSADSRLDVDDQSSEDDFFWPAISASVAAAARAFRDQLKDPNALQTYQALLPADEQGQPGAVVIHHTPGFSESATVKAITTWDTGDARSFDQLGHEINLATAL